MRSPIHSPGNRPAPRSVSRRGVGRWILALLCAMPAVVLPANGDPPSWVVTPAEFETTMSITGMAVRGDLPAMSAGDLLAAFVRDPVTGDDLLRGVAQAVQVGGDTCSF